MADVKWIKIATDIFDNRKIKVIEAMPEGDALIVTWFKLLCLAGVCNDDGQIYITKELPYTEESLAVVVDKPLPIVRLALQTFQQFGMIEIVDNFIHLSNWEKYQNVDGMERIRERDREWHRKKRAEAKALLLAQQNVDRTSNDMSTDVDAQSKKENKIKNKNTESKSVYGTFENVKLTPSELEKLKEAYPDWQEKIDRLSGYIASKGDKYKSHYATICNWAREDAKKQESQKGSILWSV